MSTPILAATTALDNSSVSLGVNQRTESQFIWTISEHSDRATKRTCGQWSRILATARRLRELTGQEHPIATEPVYYSEMEAWTAITTRAVTRLALTTLWHGEAEDRWNKCQLRLAVLKAAAE